MTPSTPWLKCTINFFLNRILNCYDCSQITELFHLFKRAAINLSIVISSCILISRHDYVLNFLPNIIHHKRYTTRDNKSVVKRTIIFSQGFFLVLSSEAGISSAPDEAWSDSLSTAFSSVLNNHSITRTFAVSLNKSQAHQQISILPQQWHPPTILNTCIPKINFSIFPSYFPFLFHIVASKKFRH
jgi:hypothetical protein